MAAADYGLAKRYFSPNQQDEEGVFLGPKQAKVDQIIGAIRRTVQTGRVPKAVILGVFGIGKTQFIRYAAQNLSDVARAVYVECPPCHRRSRFVDIQNVILRKLGRDFVLELFGQAIKTAETRGVSFDSLFGLDEKELPTVIKAGVQKDKLILWRYLSGEKLRPTEINQLSAVHPQIYEDQAIWILNAIAKLVRLLENRQLILFFDEFENTVGISGDSLAMFREAVRGLVDERSSVGTVFVISGRDEGDLPVAVTDEAIKRRIGLPNYILFSEYTPNELEVLIKEVISHARRSDFHVADVMSKLKGSQEKVNESTYPFSETATKNIVQFVVYLRKHGKIDAIRPKEALMIMDEALAVADAKTVVLDSNLVDGITKRFVTEMGAMGTI